MPRILLLGISLIAASTAAHAGPDNYSDKYLTQSSRTERLRDLDERYSSKREKGDGDTVVIYEGTPDMPVLDSGNADPFGSRQPEAPGNVIEVPPRTPNPAVDGSAGFAPTYSAGNDVPLRSAVRQIVPQGGCWVLKIEPGVNETPVTWDGRGRAWRDVLDRAVREKGLSVVMDAGICTIAIARTQSMAMSMLTGGESFTLNPAQSLRENLTRWSAESGWTLIWDVEGYDYVVEVDATFFGPLEGEDGVLSKVLEFYRNAELPLRGMFTADGSGMRVLRIVPRTHRVKGEGA